jgi:hypothetical protein
VTAKCDRKQYPGELFILEKAKRIDRPFSFKDFCPPLSHGYFRNCIWRLRDRIIRLPKTCPGFYILKERQNRYPSLKNMTTHPIRVPVLVSRGCKGGLEPKRVWSSFSGFLESLPPTDLVQVHDVHLRFNAAEFRFIDSGWSWSDYGVFGIVVLILMVGVAK